MAKSATDVNKLAIGHDNEAGLERLDEIDPPLLQPYRMKGGILTEWYDGEEEERDGHRALVYVARPYDVWKFKLLDPDDVALLNTYVGPVTARIYNKTTATWGNYNARFELPQRERKWEEGSDYWAEVTAYLWDLEEL